MALRLVAGLGNPGPRYERTRHNVGFMVLDGLAASSAWRTWKEGGGGEYNTASFSDEVWLIRPLTFMNLSGPMIQSFARFHKIGPGDMLVCHDDSDLPLGQLRLRLKGSSGGHRGMQSLIDALGTEDIPRLRVGIRAEASRGRAGDIVLETFTAAERASLREPLADAREAVALAWREGLEAAMNRYNPARPKPA